MSNTPKAPNQVPAHQPRDLLGDMIIEEQAEVDWGFTRQSLDSHVTAKFEREMRIARQRLRDVITAASPYLITTEKDEPHEQA